MVKLRVTARVIPEDVYLNNIDTATAPNVFIRDERRLAVIIRDTDNWYIGTLALEIKRRYESLYKHDLGQIKYLKDNRDDCDLDPELYVNDALVDEGKALTDASDQHVTIKVIQEQGRSLRHGSVVPDLSQTHYHLPERPSRPPIPSFNGVNSSLGKRKAENEVQRGSTERKRTRLDEIEEEHGEDVIASIEQGQPLRSDFAVDNTQSTVTDPVTSRELLVRNTSSPGMAWSFSQLGPPTVVEKSSRNERGQEHDTVRQKSSEGKGRSIEASERQALNRTPSVNGTKTHGVSTISPLAAASSASKKFLHPRMNLYTEPDSDIDDSQMSPGSRDTTRITPRLVPSGKTVGLDRPTDIDNHKSISRKLSGLSEKKGNSDDRRVTQPPASTLSIAADSVSSLDEDEAESSDDARSESSTNTQIREFEATGVATGMRQTAGQTNHVTSGSHSSNERSTSADVPQMAAEIVSSLAYEQLPSAKSQIVKPTSDMVEPQPDIPFVSSPGRNAVGEPSQHAVNISVLSATMNDRLQDLDDGNSDATSEISSNKAKTNKKRRRRARTSAMNIGDITDPLEHNTVQRRDGESTGSVRTDTAKKIQPISRAFISEVSTPAPDSPSEQLSQALQESARKTTRTSILEFKPATAIMETIREVQNSSTSKDQIAQFGSHGTIPTSTYGAPAQTAHAEIPSDKWDKSVSMSANDKMDLDQVVEATDVASAATQIGTLLANGAKANVVSLAPSAQAVRESSIDSRMTSSSRATILPPGMTQEQFDRMVRQNAHLNAAGPKRVQKRAISTLRQTPSAELPGGKLITPVNKAQSPATSVAIASTVVKEVPKDKEATKETSDTTNAAKIAEAKPAETSKKANNNGKNSGSETSAAKAKSALSRTTSSNSNMIGGQRTPVPEVVIPKKAQARSTKSASVVPSVPDTSTKSASQSSPKASISAGLRQSTPSLSNTSKVTSSTSKSAVKEPARTIPKSMLPPSSSVKTKTSTATATTPTPKPRAKPAATKAIKPTPASVPAVAPIKSKSSASKRPAPPPAYSSARSLQELRIMVNSTGNSTASNSPAPSTSRFAPVKKSILNNDSESSTDSSSEDDDDEDSNTKDAVKPKPQSTPAKSIASKPTPATKRPAIKSRPDPTIRDASVDSSEAESDD